MGKREVKSPSHEVQSKHSFDELAATREGALLQLERVGADQVARAWDKIPVAERPEEPFDIHVTTKVELRGR